MKKGTQFFHKSEDKIFPPNFSVLGIRIRIRIHRTRMFLGLPDPDPLVRGMDRLRILPFLHK
jgi:hypothetical protein